MKKLILLLLLFASMSVKGLLFAQAENRAAPVAQTPASYSLAVRDRISFAVLNEPETASEQRIDGNGRIQLPYIGSLKIAGLTVRQAEALIAAAYVTNNIYIEPQIMVRVIEYTVRDVSVLGQVNQPGKIVFPIEAKSLDIREVISQAGGFTNIARSSRVLVTRETGGQKETFEVDVDKMLSRRKDDKSDLFLVQAGDVIFVPERFF